MIDLLIFLETLWLWYFIYCGFNEWVRKQGGFERFFGLQGCDCEVNRREHL